MAIIAPDTSMVSYDAFQRTWANTGTLPIWGIDPMTQSEKREEWGYPPYDGDKDKGLNLPCTNKKLLLL